MNTNAKIHTLNVVDFDELDLSDELYHLLKRYMNRSQSISRARLIQIISSLKNEPKQFYQRDLVELGKFVAANKIDAIQDNFYASIKK